MERLRAGLVFAGSTPPMTVQFNNVINTTTGERLYHVNMAATILTSVAPGCAVLRVRPLVREAASPPVR